MTNTITREQIQHKLNSKESITIVEALPATYFETEHLPGAINIPHDQIHEKAPGMLPDKEAFIVVYCANTACQNSRIATQLLQQMGYTNVHEYVEGKQHWTEANLPVHTGVPVHTSVKAQS